MGEISADKNMERPIDGLVWAAWGLARRAKNIASWEPGTVERFFDCEMGREFVEKEEEMVVAYSIALKARYAEVCEYAAAAGLECSKQNVLDNPIVAAAEIHEAMTK